MTAEIHLTLDEENAFEDEDNEDEDDEDENIRISDLYTEETEAADWFEAVIRGEVAAEI